MKNGKKNKKKLYSILASLSCLNLGVSGCSNALENNQLLENNLHNKSIEDNNTNDSLKMNKSKNVLDDSYIDASYQENLKQQEEWRRRIEGSNSAIQKNTHSFVNSDSNGKEENKLKYVVDNFIEPTLAVIGFGSVVRNIYPGMKFLISYRHNSDIRNFKKLLTSSITPGITAEYQCIMANASIPDDIVVSNDSIPCLNKQQQLESMPLYKSIQIFKDDGNQKRRITFGENVKTPDSFLIQKPRGKLILEFDKKHLTNDLKVYVKADELDLKLSDISISQEDTNWGITIYKADKLTLFLDVPKDKIKKL